MRLLGKSKFYLITNWRPFLIHLILDSHQDKICQLISMKKIEFLYRIGFLGMMADKEMMTRLGLLTNHAFYFNEGDTPLGTISTEGFKKYQFIIHPIFSEYLALDTSQNELIMNYSWKYLHETEAISFT